MRRVSTTDIIYANVLAQIDCPLEAARKMHRIFQNEDELVDVLEDPTIDKQVKFNIIEKIFDKEVQNFLKVTVEKGMVKDVRAIYNQYKEIYFTEKNMVLCHLTYAEKPSEEIIENITKFLEKKFNCVAVEYEMIEDKSLIGGFRIRVGDWEVDNSFSGILEELKRKLNKI